MIQSSKWSQEETTCCNWLAKSATRWFVYTIVFIFNRCSIQPHIHLYNSADVPCLTAAICCHHQLSSLQKNYWESLTEISWASSSLPGAIGVENCISDTQTTEQFPQWTAQIILHFITFCYSQSRFIGFRVRCCRKTRKRGRSSVWWCCRPARDWVALLAGAPRCWEPMARVGC